METFMEAWITDPAAPHGLRLGQFPQPEPLPHEALVQVSAYSISRGELTLLKLRPDGFRPGQEVTGIVAVAAADGSGPPRGTRVTGLSHNGTWAEMVAVPTAALGIVPDGVDDAAAVALCGSGLMAYRALRSLGPLEGRRVLVIGAAGAVGNVAVQLASHEGANVTALVHSLERAGQLAEIPGVAVVSEFEGVGHFDAILDGVGGDMTSAAVRRLAPDGTILIYGNLGATPATISPADFRNAPGARMMAFFLWLTDNATFGHDISELCAMTARGELAPPVGRCLDWTATPEMVRALSDGSVLGKAVLTIGS